MILAFWTSPGGSRVLGKSSEHRKLQEYWKVRSLRVTSRLGLIVVGVAALAAVGCGTSSEEEETLSVGLIPNQSPEEVQAAAAPSP